MKGTEEEGKSTAGQQRGWQDNGQTDRAEGSVLADRQTGQRTAGAQKEGGKSIVAGRKNRRGHRGKRAGHIIMAEAARKQTWSGFRYWFVDTIGWGTCNGCEGQGPVGKLCLECSGHPGMVLEACFVCGHQGPVWCWCKWCDHGQHVTAVYGECNACELKGPFGEKCDEVRCEPEQVYGRRCVWEEDLELARAGRGACTLRAGGGRRREGSWGDDTRNAEVYNGGPRKKRKGSAKGSGTVKQKSRRGATTEVSIWAACDEDVDYR